MESVKSTPFSSPQGTPTKSFSPTPQEYQEERTRLNGIIEEKVCDYENSVELAEWM